MELLLQGNVLLSHAGMEGLVKGLLLLENRYFWSKMKQSVPKIEMLKIKAHIFKITVHLGFLGEKRQSCSLCAFETLLLVKGPRTAERTPRLRDSSVLMDRLQIIYDSCRH